MEVFIFKESSLLFKLFMFIQVVLIVLKFGEVITWPWFLVLIPIELVGAVIVLVLVLALAMAIMEMKNKK